MKKLIKSLFGYFYNITLPLIAITPGKKSNGNFESFHRINIIHFLEKWAPTISGDVLDIGAGTWTFPRQLLNNSCKYLAVDSFSHPNVDIVCDIYQIDQTFRPGTFDFILCTDVLEHMSKPWLAVYQLHTILKPGGILLLTTPFFYRLHSNQACKDYWRITEDGLLELLANTAGFREIKTEAIGHKKLPYTITAVARK